MKSIRAQLLVTLVAIAVAAGFFGDRGLPPNVGNRFGAGTGDTAVIRRNLRWGVDIGVTGPYGITPLMFAVMRGHEDAAALLLESGADVNGRGGLLVFTPLHLANDANMAALLIANGADVNAPGLDGATPLQIAVEEGNADLADLLRRHGARE